MKYIAVVTALLCHAAAAYGEPADTCLADCASQGGSPVVCQAHCAQFEEKPPEQAAQPATPPPPRRAPQQPVSAIYIYADYGAYFYNGTPGYDFTDGLRLGGGYQFNRYFSLEGTVSIISNANTEATLCGLVTCVSDSMEASSYQVAAIGTVPLDEHNGLFGKLGVANTSLKYSYTRTPCTFGFCGTPVTGSGSVSGSTPVFGFGWEDYTYPFKFRVMYENMGAIELVTHYSDNTSKTNRVGLDIFSASLMVLF